MAVFGLENIDKLYFLKIHRRNTIYKNFLLDVLVRQLCISLNSTIFFVFKKPRHFQINLKKVKYKYKFKKNLSVNRQLESYQNNFPIPDLNCIVVFLF